MVEENNSKDEEGGNEEKEEKARIEFFQECSNMQKHISSLMDMHAEIWTAYFQATEEKLKRRSAIKVDSPMMPDMKS